MSNSEETCGNIKSLKAFKILSLCLSCKNYSGCGYRLASDLIGKIKLPGVRQEHIITACFSYQKVRTFNHRTGEEVFNKHLPVVGNLQPQLWEASVKNLCSSCPSEVKGGCERHKDIDNLAAASHHANTWVEAQVVCCNQSERLYQISEPTKRSP